MTENTYNKSDVIEKNYSCFEGAMTDLRVEQAEKMIESSKVSTLAIKSLTLDFVKEAKKLNSNSQKNKFVDMIEAWSINLNQCKWHEELIDFCKRNRDINGAFSVQNNGNEEFIIVMDDVTDENVLSYNEFGFELRKRYNEIYDFMVLDSSMINSIESMFEKIEKIYERGSECANGI